MAELNEKQVLEMSKAIQKRTEEEKLFIDGVKRVISGKKAAATLTVGAMPNALYICDAECDTLTIGKDVVSDAMHPEALPDVNKNVNGLTEQQLTDAVSGLSNPLVVLQSPKDNTLVAVTSIKDYADRTTYVACEIDSKTGSINSVIGGENKEALAAALKGTDILACNEERADEIYKAFGARFSVSKAVLTYDDRIAFSKDFIRMHEEAVDDNKTKLLPILNAKYIKHTSKMDALGEKIAVIEDKISHNATKIQKLRTRAERLEDINQMLEEIKDSVPGIKFLQERNRAKLTQIRETLIPKHQGKIQMHTEKLEKYERKLSLVSAKADRVKALSGVIKSFTTLDSTKRIERFVRNFNMLQDSSRRIVACKLEDVNAKIARLNDDLQNALSNVQKYDIKTKTDDLNARKDKLEDKLTKYNKVSHLAETDKNVEQQIEKAERAIEQAQEITKIPELADNVQSAASEEAVVQTQEIADNVQTAVNEEVVVQTQQPIPEVPDQVYTEQDMALTVEQQEEIVDIIDSIRDDFPPPEIDAMEV